MKKGIFILLLVLSLSLVSALQVPFNQCVNIVGADVDDINCFFSQTGNYTNASMTASANNQFCFLITDEFYKEGAHPFSVYCNDSSYSASLSDEFIIGDSYSGAQSQQEQEEKGLRILDFLKEHPISYFIIFIIIFGGADVYSRFKKRRQRQ